MNTRKILAGVVIVVAGVFLLSAPCVIAQDVCEGNFDYDQDVDGTDAAVFKEDFGRHEYVDPCPPTSPCPFTCQGSLSPLGRWCVNGDGTVRDMHTCLIWLIDASWPGSDWQLYGPTVNHPHASNALAQCYTGGPYAPAELQDGSGPGMWRLPTSYEMDMLISGTEPAFVYGSDLYGTLFTNMRNDLCSYSSIGECACGYWTSDNLVSFQEYGWIVYFNFDNLGRYVYMATNSDYRDDRHQIWPVRNYYPDIDN